MHIAHMQLCFSAVVLNLAFLRDVLLLGDQCSKMLVAVYGQALDYMWKKRSANTREV